MKKTVCFILLAVILMSFSVYAKDTLYGDVNGDEEINGTDLTLLAQHFAGWSVIISDTADANGDGSINGTDLTLLAQHFAGWDVVLGSEIKYIVTFTDYNGTVLKEESVSPHGAATAPEAPTRTDYIFKGWDREFNDITCDITVKAVYLSEYTGRY